jgi:GTPase SAR1 family protein
MTSLENELKGGKIDATYSGLISIVIHGLGGFGKSSIALEYIYRYYDDYPVILWLYVLYAVRNGSD